ncbi:MAG: rhomboid family intramembrane serine protease [Elusimicrobia bacterium]|nr:rhomboid family intramembrane serine protease [Elusimicrobiota bacterium]
MIPLRDNIPSRRIPFVNYVLIGINIIAFLSQIRMARIGAVEEFILLNGVIPNQFLDDPFDRARSLVTSQFLHGGWMHILGNMLYLYIFGDNVEDRLGHWRFLGFYLFCGISASLAQIYFHQNSTVPMIGASGSIAGVLGAYFFFFPRARVLTLIPIGYFSRIVELPAFLFLGFWFVIQMFSGTASLYAAKTFGGDAGGIAWFAHAGGFLAGFLGAIFLVWKRA